jgi:putative SOS response-associated peptidase YedK
MCGRFTNKMSLRELFILYRTYLDDGDKQAVKELWAGKINIAPTTDIPVVYLTHGLDGMARKLTLMRWGLIPSWSKNIGKFSTFNARAKGIDQKPAYRDAWKANRRCLIPANSFFEWRKTDNQPFAIGLGNKGPMAFAGLWETWAPQNATPIVSCAIITTEANALTKDVHARVPVIVDEEHWPAWLGEEPANPDHLKALMTPFSVERMSAWPVSKAVGNVRNQGGEMVEEV